MTPELAEKLAGRRVVLSVSGGKDSAAASLWLTERGIGHDRVFCDTGWEHPTTYEYLRGPLTAKLGPIVEIRAPLGMVDLIRKKAMFPSRRRRFCTEELKVRPMRRHLAAMQDAGTEVINATGVRAAESEARSVLPEWEWQEAFDCETWRPILRLTEPEVILLHKRHGLPPNPLYLKGATRVGCWPCIHARKAEIKLWAQLDPQRVALVRELEAELTAAAKQRNPNAGQRGFFQAPVPNAPGRRPAWGIDQIVEWSGIAQTGWDFPEADPGCMRWGICDTGTKSGGGEP